MRVAKRRAQKALAILKDLGLLDRELKPRREGDLVLLPLLRDPSDQELEFLRQEVGDIEISEADFPVREKPRSLLDLLSTSLPPDALEKAPRSFDIIGDIAVVELEPELWPYASTIGSAIMALHKKVRLVLAKKGPISGDFRLRGLSPIAGSGPTETTHREHGCFFRLDVARVYFSPRLSYEHARVASQAHDGELVVDMFAGVGPFPILMAKQKALMAYAVDLNPVAFHYLTLNVVLNRVRGKVVPLLADARSLAEGGLPGLADRVVMNLPERAHEFLEAACTILRPEGGTIHFYTFAGGSSPELEAIERLREGVRRAGRSVRRILLVRKVRAVAPFRWQIVVDAEVV